MRRETVEFISSDKDTNSSLERTSTVTFKQTEANGDIKETKEITVIGTDSELIDVTSYAPTVSAWKENDAFTYQFVGWSREQQISKGVEDTEEDYLKYLVRSYSIHYSVKYS